MTCKYEILNSAKAEFRAIISYLNKATGSSSTSKKLAAEYDDKIRLVREHPEMYQLVEDSNLAALSYRKFSFGSYVCLYIYRDDCIYVAHIFHQRQDYARLI